MLFYGNDIGRLVAIALRPMTAILIIVAILAWGARRRWVLVLAGPAIVFALMLGIAEASRIVAVYIGAAALGAVFIGRRVTAVFLAFGALIAVGYVLEARDQDQLGLSHLSEHASAVLAAPGLGQDIAANLGSGLLVTSASARLAVPEAYGERYKLTSFLPSIDRIDGFQVAKAQFEQRVLSYVPFNAFAEAALFGPGYALAFWSVLAACVLAVNSSIRFGPIIHLALMCLFCLGWVIAWQYPVRNCMRYFYVILFIRAVLPMVEGWLPARRSPLQARS